MDLGFEASKGAAERVLGVKLPILMRLILPGLLATAVLYPAVAWMLGHFPVEAERFWERIAGYAVLVLLLGALISTTNSEIYKVYEGRVLWPAGLRKWGIERQQAGVDKLLKESKATSDQEQYDELWYRLRVYKTNGEGLPFAIHPTRIGNILAGYEQYPNTRYGMDSVFYWPRIWLQIEMDKKEEIDEQWSVADGFLTLSAISFGGTLIWSAQALAAAFVRGLPGLPLGAPGFAFLGALLWLALGFFWYKLSLPFHRENGEVYKAIFDIYREKVSTMTGLKPNERELWEAAWAYLQYLMVKCANCGKYTAAGNQCEKCGFVLLELKKNLSSSGKFPIA